MIPLVLAFGLIWLVTHGCFKFVDYMNRKTDERWNW